MINRGITIGDGIFITIFSMIIVFLVLMFISFLIDIMKNIINKEKNTIKKNDKITNEKDFGENDMKNLIIDEDTEVIAAITAAIAMMMDVDIPKINIKSIKRIDNAWKNTARSEQVINKL